MCWSVSVVCALASAWLGSLLRLWLLTVSAGAATTSFADQSAIQTLFPNTYGQPAVHIEPVPAGEKKKKGGGEGRRGRTTTQVGRDGQVGQ